MTEGRFAALDSQPGTRGTSRQMGARCKMTESGADANRTN
jgi:hypothetical protein